MPYSVWVWNISSLEPISVITCSNQIKSIRWTKKENYLCIISGNDRILFWRQNGTIAECIFSFQHKKLSIQRVKWSNDGTKALISDKNDFGYAELIPEGLEKSSIF